MPTREGEEMTEVVKKEIFEALVIAQDGGMTFAQSHKFVGEKFEVNESQIRRIEREGLDKQWPPL